MKAVSVPEEPRSITVSNQLSTGRLLTGAVLACAFCAGNQVAAQAEPRLGLDLSIATRGALDDVEPSIGATLHLGPHFALRPLVSYTKTSSVPFSLVATGVAGADLGPTKQSTSEEWGGGLGLLYYLKRSQELSPYLFSSLSLLERTQSDPGLGDVLPASRDRRTLKLWRAGLGVQYKLKDKLALFGEAGVRHASARDYSHTSTFSSTLGVIFYLR